MAELRFSPHPGGPSWPTASLTPPHYAYATLVSSPSFVIGAQLLAHSLRVHRCAFPLLCLCPSTLPPTSLHSLSTSGLHPVLVPPLPTPFATPPHVPSWSSPALTKLRLFALTPYHRLLYLDADTLVTAHLDPLLHTPTPFAAAPDLFPPTRFNAGVLLLQPSLTTYAQLIRRLEATPSYDGGDTGFLNAVWDRWWEGAEGQVRLSFGYNAQRAMEWWTRKGGGGYWDAIGPVSVVHYSSAPKVWEARRGGRLEQAWWALHDQWQEARKRSPPPNALPIIDFAHPQLPPSAFASPIPFPSSMRSVPFDAAMGQRTLRSHLWSSSDTHCLTLLSRRYSLQAQLLNDEGEVSRHQSSATLIPRRIHQVWLGSEVPKEFDEWRASWQRLHPAWLYTLHTSLRGFPHSCTPQDALYPRLQSLMASAVGYAQQSDILRLDLLLAFGGVYADTDFQCLQPLDALHSLPISLYCGLANVGAVEVGNSIIASCSRHPLIERALRDMRIDSGSSTQRGGEGSTARVEPMRVIEGSGPGHWTRVVLGWLMDEEQAREAADGTAMRAEVLILPPSFLYPLPNNLRGLLPHAEERRLFYRAESLAVHHWACSWQGVQSALRDVGQRGEWLDVVHATEGSKGAVPSAIAASNDDRPRALPDELLNRISAFL